MSGKKRLLFFTGVYDTLDLFTEELSHAFLNMGYETLTLDVKNIQDGLAALAQFIMEPVTAGIVFNNLAFNMELVEGENLWEKLNIPCINILMDHPCFYHGALAEAPCNAVVLCTDKNHMKYVGRYYPNIPAAGYLPHAGCIHIGEYKKLEERSIDVLYAGGLSAYVNEGIRPDWSKYEKFDGNKLSEDIYRRLIQNPSMTTEEALEEWFAKSGQEITEDEFRLLMTDMRYMEENQIIFLKVDASKVSGLPYNQLWSREMYYRLMLPELLGGEIDRILYLDTDIIVNKGILDFYNTDFEGKLLAVTKDMEFDTILAMDEPDSRVRNVFFKKLTEEDGMVYFCSGVLLMNLERLKEQYSFSKYKQIFDSVSDKMILPDQDLLNYVHYKQVKYVDEMRFDLFAQSAHDLGMTYDEVVSNVSIIHFTGRAKPWTINLVRYDIEKIWWEYAKDSPFYGELLERVFYNSMESHFAEDKIQELIDENSRLREMLGKCQDLIQKLSVDR